MTDFADVDLSSPGKFCDWLRMRLGQAVDWSAVGDVDLDDGGHTILIVIDGGSKVPNLTLTVKELSEACRERMSGTIKGAS